MDIVNVRKWSRNETFGGRKMLIKDDDIFKEASTIIKDLYGDSAVFREGQYEAIEATLINNRTLVVQKTGWGKSLVYFTCTKILRNRKQGVTIVVSPLLTLMENQIEAATKLGLKCDVLNSSVKDRRTDIINDLKQDRLDLLLVTPETLFKEDVMDAIRHIKIGLFVIDEAHCISDWGHDFRLDYSNLYKILGILPTIVPVLATTATANNRVVEDLKQQLGNDVYVSRGPLTRESLAIQVLKMKSKAERYGWILQNINRIPGSGIIYCLTQRDCDYLADFLNQNKISAMSYYSRNMADEQKNTEAEKLFKENKIKVLVATIKLGMGYDKGDISFVIHFQQPPNIVSYYQQIGRAGRNIEKAYAFLMCGQEDEKIIDHFNNTAFPSEKNCKEIIHALEMENGLTINGLSFMVNMKLGVIKKVLSFLINEGLIYKTGTEYYLTAHPFKYNKAHYDAVIATRKDENAMFKEFIHTNQCYSQFIVQALDDDEAKECHICSNCRGEEIIPSKVDNEYIEKAQEYINHLIIKIVPRKKWPKTEYTNQTNIPHINEVGICLSKYGDIGYGDLVKKGKYSMSGVFSDQLVGKSRDVLMPIIEKEKIMYMTCIPSLRSQIVEEFTKRLAISCGVKFIETLIKKQSPQQKEMQNSSYQCENALSSFTVDENVELPDKIILVDDIIDSGWTMSVCGYRLMEKGCEKVFPFALADSSQKGVE